MSKKDVAPATDSVTDSTSGSGTATIEAEKPASNGFTSRLFNTIVATAVLLIMVIPVGVANIYLGFMLQESPCTLCGYERFGMVVIATLGVLIIRFGPHYKYLVTLILAAAFFAYSALRHWAGHIPGDLGQGFGGAMFGVHTYTWALVVFWIVSVAIAAGLFFIVKSKSLHKELSGEVQPVKKFTKYVAVVVAISFGLTVTNAFQFLITNGPPPFTGTGDPARLTLDIGKSSDYWSADMYSRLATAKLHNFSAPPRRFPASARTRALSSTWTRPLAPSHQPVSLIW